MIPHIPRIEVEPVAMNTRLWELVAKEHARTISAPEQLELNKLFLAMDADQDNREANHG